MASNKKVVGGEGVDSETSSVPNIFALGDVLQGRPELTPVGASSMSQLGTERDSRERALVVVCEARVRAFT